MNKTMKKLLSLALAAAMCSAAVPAFAGTGTSVGNADGGISTVHVYEDFESYGTGMVRNTTGSGSSPVITPESHLSMEDGTYEIVELNNNKVMKITEPANSSGSAGIKLAISAAEASVLNECDYFVVKFDTKNGDSAANRFPYMTYLSHTRDSGDGLSKDGYGGIADFRHSMNNYGWNSFMYIGKNDGSKTLRMVVNGEVVADDNGSFDMKSDRLGNKAAEFFGLLIYNRLPQSFDQVMYVDDMEIYGIKNVNRQSKVRLDADSEASKVYADFDYPVIDFDTTKVTVDNGAAVSSVALVDGRYEIQLSGLTYGTSYTVNVSGVTDVFGTTVDANTTTISGPKPTLVKVGYQSIDFESTALTTDGGYFTNGSQSTDGEFENAYPAAGRNFDIVEKNGSRVMKITENALGQNNFVWLNYNNKTSLKALNPDWYVLSYDMQNGDSAGNAITFLQQRREFLRNDGESLQEHGACEAKLFDTGNQPIKQYSMNHYTMIGDAANNVIYLALGSKLVAYNNDTASKAIETPMTTQYNGQNGVIYTDNWEMYGLNNGSIINNAHLTPAGDTAVYADFDLPLSQAGLTAADVTVDGGAAVDSVAFDVNEGKWKISLKDYNANTTYNVTVKGVTDVFGTTTEPATIAITTPRLEMPKTYLTTSTFAGYEDFEGYSATGAFETKASTPVTITRTSDGVNIKSVWSNSTGSQDTVECSLVDDGTGNHAYKISAVEGVEKNQTTGIFQPAYDTNWTEQSRGKYFVYELKFKAGSDTEEPLGTQYFETQACAVSLDHILGKATLYKGGSVVASVDNAFVPKQWNTLQYVVDCTLSVPKEYVLINGNLIGTAAVSNLDLRNGKPRMGAVYCSGEVGASVYFDDVAIYTIPALEIKNVTIGADSVTVSTASAYENDVTDVLTADVWVAVYNSTGTELVNVAKASAQVDYGYNDYTASITVADGQKVKAFIWNDSLVPLCSAWSN